MFLDAHSCVLSAKDKKIGIKNYPKVHLKKFLYQTTRRLDIHTAASHKPKEWWKKSFETKRDAKWIFGIDGLPKESSIYRINQDGEYLFEIMKMGVEMDMNIWWQMILFKYNQDSLEEVMSICEKNNINFKLIKSNRFTKNDPLRPI